LNYILLLNNNPTVGVEDGDNVSSGDRLNPVLSDPLDTSFNEESLPIKLAIRCIFGYETSNNVKITPFGENEDRWSLALDDNEQPGIFLSYGDSLEINEVIKDKNYVFWVKDRTISGELPVNDKTVSLKVETKISSNLL